MCPNCFNAMVMSLGGAGSALLLAAGLGFRALPAMRRTPASNREENAS